MTDVVDKATRSRMMSGICGKDTKPEIIIRKGLHKSGFRFRLHDKTLPGKPDLVLKKYNAVIFINGCFWHGHDCPAGKLPETNKKFWEEKIAGNVERDKRNKAELEKLGWKVITIWQCELKNKNIRMKVLGSLTSMLHKRVHLTNSSDSGGNSNEGVK